MSLTQAHMIARGIFESNVIPDEYVAIMRVDGSPALNACLDQYIEGTLKLISTRRKETLAVEAGTAKAAQFAAIRLELYRIAQGAAVAS